MRRLKRLFFFGFWVFVLPSIGVAQSYLAGEMNNELTEWSYHDPDWYAAFRANLVPQIVRNRNPEYVEAVNTVASVIGANFSFGEPVAELGSNGIPTVSVELRIDPQALGQAALALATSKYSAAGIGCTFYSAVMKQSGIEVGPATVIGRSYQPGKVECIYELLT